MSPLWGFIRFDYEPPIHISPLRGLISIASFFFINMSSHTGLYQAGIFYVNKRIIKHI
jgi:hypothetical protein